MTVSRLRDIPGIGVDIAAEAADAAADPEILRLENLDTDLRPPAVALSTTRDAIIRVPPQPFGSMARPWRRRERRGAVGYHSSSISCPIAGRPAP